MINFSTDFLIHGLDNLDNNNTVYTLEDNISFMRASIGSDMELKNTLKVFISGPITGVANYKENFANAEKELKNRGFKVINPVRETEDCPDDTTWSDYMNITLQLLQQCDAIYMLNGWQESIGARIENLWAYKTDMVFFYQNEKANIKIS